LRKKQLKKKRNVSVTDPIIDDARGAAYQIFFLKASKIWTSKFWEIKNATPEPIAILIEIVSEKLVDTNNVKITPIVKPTYTIFLATNLP